MASADLGTGLNEDTLREMSSRKGEPGWMLDFRLKSHQRFEQRPRPSSGGDTSALDFDAISYSITANGAMATAGGPMADDRDEIPDAITNTFERSRDELQAQGVLFCDMDTALKDYPQLVKEYFGKVIPPNDNPYSELNSAAWTGGSFVYVPPGVEVEIPLQTSFRANARNTEQFDRTLIIADEGSRVHYIEGCSAPTYTSDSLHSAVVEIVVKPSARVSYTTIQNWSDNVFSLVTKRAYVEAEGHMEWIDGNIGSKLTMTYPAIVLAGPKASGDVLSVATAGPNQHQDTGAKIIHAAPETTSRVVSKSVSKDGGRTSYRDLVRVEDDAHGCKSHVQCDALILDEASICDTYPSMEIGPRDAIIGHETTVSRVPDEQLFYLQSRGLTEQQATSMIVNGFIEPVTRALPIEYAVEWCRLIELQMEGSVG